ncbi:PP2C family protein-serine/threonine phosphatase [Magnetofaba australis]|uniref:Putative response regulator receiver protein n=1 Tax=Magnetofaba australis IT-1 TaxID=1434232 RepID=A0A1Y2K2N0_9PROT|nr:PP2C family protein-serine/threonine phosphatase [Magnetofaba australis]OSM00452.1 putative response regulator receiver protein [Magnetofaba australis IT-1]
MTHKSDSKGQNSAHAPELEIIARAEELLSRQDSDVGELRTAFAELLKDYKKLDRMISRLNRINDRNQLVMRKQQDKLLTDQNMVEEILDKMRQHAPVDEKSIHKILLPLDNTGGDLLLSMARPDGVRHILLGDVTGHGLPAAIVAPEVSKIFHAMTAKGFASGMILQELNQRLHEQLPTGFYMAALLLEVDEPNQRVSVWNGGLPPSLLIRDGAVESRWSSGCFPLGMVKNGMQIWRQMSYALQAGDRIVFYTDGITESANAEEEQFGVERLEQALLGVIRRGEALESILDEIRAFIGGKGAFEDDITLIELII